MQDRSADDFHGNHRQDAVAGETGITFAELREALTVQRLHADGRGVLYTAPIQREPSDRVFGGLLLAQAIMTGAAGQLPPGAVPLSLQAEFLEAVPTDGPVTWLVEDLGTTPTMRSVRASVVRSDDRPLFTANVRYAPVRQELPSYSLVQPRRVAAPESLPDLASRYEGRAEIPRWWRIPRPVAFRHVEPPSYLTPEAPPSAEQTIWWRAPVAEQADPTLAAAVAAYVSDMSVVEPVFRQTRSARHKGLSRILSLTHTMTFHHPAPLGEWIQMDCAVLALAHGRARGTAEMHCDGGHVASVSQLALVKLDGSESTAEGAAEASGACRVAPGVAV